MIRLILATIFTILPILGYFLTDGSVLAQMDQTILKLMAAKIIIVALFLVYIIFIENTSTETK